MTTILMGAEMEAKHLAELKVDPGYILPSESDKQPVYDIPEELPRALVQAMVDIIPSLPDMRLQFYCEHGKAGKPPKTAHDDRPENRDPSRFPPGSNFGGHTKGQLKNFRGLAR